MNYRFTMLLLTTASFVTPVAVAAQANPQSGVSSGEVSSGEIIVTARKRAETLISVPVVVTAVAGAELGRRGISSLDQIARLVPSLTIAEGGGTTQGGTISLRGISGPDTNPLGDQAVSFVIDNVQIAKSSVRRLGSFDIAQVEVLKGPQTLFFGKNSPGGIISLRTADPTKTLTAKLSAGYEFNAHEIRTEGYISGPLTETLGGRLAFYTSDMRGWVKNISAQGLPESPIRDHLPRAHEINVRGTLLWEPTDRLQARLKVSYGRMHGAGTSSNFQYILCPYGAPQFAGVVDECKANSKVSHADIGKTFTPFDSRFRDGVPYQRSNQQLVGLDMNYNLTDNLKLTSITGFYRFDYVGADHFSAGATAVPLNPFLGRPLLPSVQPYFNREITQEVRLQSDFDGVFDFTTGGLYQDTRASNGAHTLTNPDNPIEFGDYLFKQKGKAYSIFGQAIVRPIPKIEISGGGRYSHEEKRLPLVLMDNTGGRSTSAIPVTPNPDKIAFNNFSPEVTVAFKPNQDLNIFGSYKRGFLSGGFNVGQRDFALAPDASYGPQKVKGFEGGIKAALFGRRLRLNLAAYSYNVSGLQITSFESLPNGSPFASIKNAGDVSIKGVEADATLRVTDELSVRSSISYNRGRYEEYFAPCYLAQTAAQGCNLVRGGAPAQDLSNTTLRNAPEWTATGGFSYDTPIGNDLKIGLSGDINYTSKEITDAKSTPGAVSPSRALIDASLRLAQADDRWELALIGRNLSNKYYFASTQEMPLSGDAAAGRLADLIGVPSRGREIMIRASVKFGQ